MAKKQRASSKEIKEVKKLIQIPEGLSEGQNNYIEQIKTNTITFVYGPPGTGKTFIATVYALSEFLAGNYDKIIFTRPYIEACNEKIGFLPGDIQSKMKSLVLPVLNVLEEKLSAQTVENLMSTEKITTIPMGYLRGLTFKNSIVILDESQSSSKEQMRLFLTRIGENSKLIITGDLKQSDIRGENGLSDAIHRFVGIKDVGIVELDKTSIVRHPLIAEIEERYENLKINI